VCYLGSIVARPKLKGIGGGILQPVTRAVNKIAAVKFGYMRERLVKRSVGSYRREMIMITKNLNDRENPQGRLEIMLSLRKDNKQKGLNNVNLLRFHGKILRNHQKI